MNLFSANADAPLSYVSCGNLISKDEFLHFRRIIDQNIFILIKEGTLHLSQYGIQHSIGPNQYIFLKANEEHYGCQPSSGNLSYLWVHFSSVQPFQLEKEWNDDALSQSRYLIPEQSTISLSKRVPLLFNQLMDLSNRKTIFDHKILDYSLSLLMMEVTQEFIDQHQNQRDNIPPHIAQCIEWMKANYYRPISLAEIAAEFSYNPDYLSTLFKKTTGYSIVTYLNRIRIEISKTLMASYDLTIKEAAYSCGFPDEKYYMKLFKRMEGMTPTQYKQAFYRKRIN